MPKVIDFGVAKALTQKLSTETLHTRLGALVGTPEYMSPEQAASSGIDIDTRTDVYSLGTVFYELLSGARPIEFRAAGLEEFLRRLREEDTPKPSTRASTGDGTAWAEVARRRQTDPASLARQLHGDLDAIALKALEKDRSRRYGSPAEFAADIGRYLRQEPVLAVAPSAAYRTRKFAARYRWALAAAVTLVAVLVLAVIWMAIALRQQQRANVSAAALREVVRKIIIERPAALARTPNRTALRGELMRDAEGALDVLSRDLRGDDTLQAELAKAYFEIALAKGSYNAAGSEGDPEGAIGYVRKSVELYSVLARAKPDDAAVRRDNSKRSICSSTCKIGPRAGKMEKVQPVKLRNRSPACRRQWRKRCRRAGISRSPIWSLGLILWAEAAFPEAIAAHRKAITLFGDGLPPGFRQDPDKLDIWSHLQRELAISVWMVQGIGPETVTDARRAVAVIAACSAPNCRMRHAQSLGTLGQIEWASGERDQGIATMRRSLAEFEALLANDPGNAVLASGGAQVRGYLILTLAHAGNGAEAVALAEKNLALPPAKDARLDKGRERTLVYHIDFGAALLGAKRLGDAEREMRQTLARNRDWDANTDLQWSALHILTEALNGQGKFQEAISSARDAQKLFNRIPGDAFYARVMRAIAARDYASAVASWQGSSAEQCAAARQALDGALAGLDRRHAVLAGALLEFPPGAEEQASLDKALSRRASW